MRPEDITIGMQVTHLCYHEGIIFTVTSVPTYKDGEVGVAARSSKGFTCGHLWLRLLTPVEQPPQVSVKAHPHAELIKAWADGADIEYYNDLSDLWMGCSHPSWNPLQQFRIKTGEPIAPVKVKYVPTQDDYLRAAQRTRYKHAVKVRKLGIAIKNLQLEIFKSNQQTITKLRKNERLARGKQ